MSFKLIYNKSAMTGDQLRLNAEFAISRWTLKAILLSLMHPSFEILLCLIFIIFLFKGKTKLKQCFEKQTKEDKIPELIRIAGMDENVQKSNLVSEHFC